MWILMVLHATFAAIGRLIVLDKCPAMECAISELGKCSDIMFARLYLSLPSLMYLMQYWNLNSCVRVMSVDVKAVVHALSHIFQLPATKIIR